MAKVLDISWLGASPATPAKASVLDVSKKIQPKKIVELVSGSIEVYDLDMPIRHIRIEFDKTRMSALDVDSLQHRLQSALSPLFLDTSRFKISLKTKNVLF